MQKKAAQPPQTTSRVMKRVARRSKQGSVAERQPSLNQTQFEKYLKSQEDGSASKDADSNILILLNPQPVEDDEDALSLAISQNPGFSTLDKSSKKDQDCLRDLIKEEIKRMMERSSPTDNNSDNNYYETC